MAFQMLISTRELTEVEAIKEWRFYFKLHQFPLIKKEISYDSQVEERIFEMGRSRINAVFTSQVAVRSVFERLEVQPNWRIFCLGGKTKSVLLNFVPESMIFLTGTNGAELAGRIREEESMVRERRTVFFCGDKRMPTLPATFDELGMALEEVVCYKTSCASSTIQGQLGGILFFSPSAVQCFFNYNPVIWEHTVLFAIGETTAAAIRAFSDNKIIVAQRPSERALLDAVKNYFENHMGE